MRNVPLPLKSTRPVKPPALGAMPMLTLLLPASRSRLALPLAVMTALMLMSPEVVCSASVLALHEMVSLTLMLLVAVMVRLVVSEPLTLVPVSSPPLAAMV